MSAVERLAAALPEHDPVDDAHHSCIAYAETLLEIDPELAAALDLGLANPELVALWRDYQHVTDGPVGMRFIDYIVARSTPRTFTASGSK